MQALAKSYIFCILMTTKSIHSGSILEALFTSQARVEVLKLFFLHSSKRHYLREVATLTDQPLRAVQRELSRLQKAGILQSNREGNRKYFQANRNSPVFPELRALMVKTAGVIEALKEHLDREPAAVRLALLFGSFARGTEEVDSDIDLLVVGKISARKLAQILKPARETLAREINLVLLTSQEFQQRAQQDDPFDQRLLEEPKTFLIGDSDELANLAGGGSS